MNNLTTITAISNKNGTPQIHSSSATVFSVFSEETPDNRDLRQIFAILKRRLLLVSGIAIFVNSAVAYSTLTQEPIYQGNFQILVESVNTDNSLERLSLLDSNIAKPSLDYESQILVLKSPELLQDVIKKLQKSYSDITYTSLIEDLNIRRFGKTKVIEVSCKM